MGETETVMGLRSVQELLTKDKKETNKGIQIDKVPVEKENFKDKQIEVAPEITVLKEEILLLEDDEVNAKDTLLKEETEERNIVLEKQPEKATGEEDSVKDIQIEKLPDVTEEKEKINVLNKEGVVGKKRVEDIQLDDVNNKVSEKKSETKEVEKEQYNRGESNVKDN